MTILTEESVALIKKELEFGVAGTEIATKYGVSIPHISHIKHKHTWKHVKSYDKEYEFWQKMHNVVQLCRDDWSLKQMVDYVVENMDV